MKKLINIFLAFLVTVLSINAFMYVKKIVLKEDFSSLFGYSYLEVITGSMVPTINVGDIVLMKETTAVDLDDIVVYKAGNIYITHRLIQIIDENYITKGDANRSSEMIKKTQVVGKIVSKSRVFGKLIKLLREPLILLILYAAWLLIIVIDNNLKKNKQIEALNSFVNPTSELLENLYNNNIPIIQQKETKKYVDLSDYIIKK